MYEPISYWQDHGKRYQDEFLAGEAYARQEAVLLRLIKELQFAEALELGCGFGRITRLVVDLNVPVTGVDLSAHQLAAASDLVPEADLIRSTIQAFEPDRQWDLVLAVEVLMHVPPAEIRAVADKMLRLSRRHIVTVDWTQPMDNPGKHNVIHDYAALFGEPHCSVPVAAQTIFHWTS